MIKKLLKTKKGMTLVELIVAMLVLSIICLAVTTVFLPVYNAYVNANDVAECNTLLDNLSAIMMEDIEDAVAVSDNGDGTYTFKTRVDVTYAVNAAGLLERSDLSTGTTSPVLAAGFYKRKTIAMSCAANGGLVTVTLSLFNTRRNGELMAVRTYSARPLGMN